MPKRRRKKVQKKELAIVSQKSGSPVKRGGDAKSSKMGVMESLPLESWLMKILGGDLTSLDRYEMNTLKLYREVLSLQSKVLVSPPSRKKAAKLIRDLKGRQSVHKRAFHRSKEDSAESNMAMKSCLLAMMTCVGLRLEDLHPGMGREGQESVFDALHHAAILLTNLGLAFSQGENTVQAESFFKQALNINRALFSNESSQVRESIFHLTSLYETFSRYEDAIACYQEIIDLDRKREGEDSKQVEAGLHLIANMYTLTHQHELACNQFEKLLSLRKIRYGHVSSAVAETLVSIGEATIRMNQFERSESAFLDAISILKRMADPHADTLLSAYRGLGAFLEDQQRLKDAHRTYQECLSMLTHLGGENQIPISKALLYLANLLVSEHQYEAAVASYQDALDRLKERDDEEHEHWSDIIGNLFRCYIGVGRISEALELKTQQIEHEKSFLDEESSGIDSYSYSLAMYVYVYYTLRFFSSLEPATQHVERAIQYAEKVLNKDERVIRREDMGHFVAGDLGHHIALLKWYVKLLAKKFGPERAVSVYLHHRQHFSPLFLNQDRVIFENYFLDQAVKWVSRIPKHDWGVDKSLVFSDFLSHAKKNVLQSQRAFAWNCLNSVDPSWLEVHPPMSGDDEVNFLSMESFRSVCDSDLWWMSQQLTEDAFAIKLMVFKDVARGDGISPSARGMIVSCLIQMRTLLNQAFSRLAHQILPAESVSYRVLPSWNVPNQLRAMGLLRDVIQRDEVRRVFAGFYLLNAHAMIRELHDRIDGEGRCVLHLSHQKDGELAIIKNQGQLISAFVIDTQEAIDVPLEATPWVWLLTKHVIKPGQRIDGDFLERIKYDLIPKAERAEMQATTSTRQARVRAYKAWSNWWKRLPERLSDIILLQDGVFIEVHDATYRMISEKEPHLPERLKPFEDWFEMGIERLWALQKKRQDCDQVFLACMRECDDAYHAFLGNPEEMWLGQITDLLHQLHYQNAPCLIDFTKEATDCALVSQKHSKPDFPYVETELRPWSLAGLFADAVPMTVEGRQCAVYYSKIVMMCLESNGIIVPIMSVEGERKLSVVGDDIEKMLSAAFNHESQVLQTMQTRFLERLSGVLKERLEAVWKKESFVRRYDLHQATVIQRIPAIGAELIQRAFQRAHIRYFTTARLDILDLLDIGCRRQREMLHQMAKINQSLGGVPRIQPLPEMPVLTLEAEPRSLDALAKAWNSLGKSPLDQSVLYHLPSGDDDLVLAYRVRALKYIISEGKHSDWGLSTAISDAYAMLGEIWANAFEINRANRALDQSLAYLVRNSEDRIRRYQYLEILKKSLGHRRVEIFRKEKEFADGYAGIQFLWLDLLGNMIEIRARLADGGAWIDSEWGRVISRVSRLASMVRHLMDAAMTQMLHRAIFGPEGFFEDHCVDFPCVLSPDDLQAILNRYGIEALQPVECGGDEMLQPILACLESIQPYALKDEGVVTWWSDLYTMSHAMERDAGNWGWQSCAQWRDCIQWKHSKTGITYSALHVLDAGLKGCLDWMSAWIACMPERHESSESLRLDLIMNAMSKTEDVSLTRSSEAIGASGLSASQSLYPNLLKRYARFKKDPVELIPDPSQARQDKGSLASILKQRWLFADHQPRERASLPWVQALAAHAAHYGFKLKDVPGDGNCLFHAVIAQLLHHRLWCDEEGQLLLDHADLRQMAANYLAAHPEMVPWGGIERERLISDMKTLRNWQGEEAILALAHRLGVNIVVITGRLDGEEPRPQVYLGGEGGDVATLVLGYEDQLHYESLERDDRIVEPERSLQGVIDEARAMHVSWPS